VYVVVAAGVTVRVSSGELSDDEDPLSDQVTAHGAVPVSSTVVSLLAPCGIAPGRADRVTVVRAVVDADFDPGGAVEPQAGVPLTEARTVSASQSTTNCTVCVNFARGDGPPVIVQT